MKSRLWIFLTALAFSGCVSMVQPRGVRVADIMPDLGSAASRPTEFPVVIERFVDERHERSVIGHSLSFGGNTSIMLDSDLAEPMEKMVAQILARKGIPRESSPLVLRGVIQSANVDPMPLTSSYRAEVALQLSIVNSSTRARLWQKTYTGSGAGSNPTLPMSLALRDLAGAIEADDSMLRVRESLPASGALPPRLAAKTAASEAVDAPAEKNSDVDNVEKRGQRRPADYALVIGIEKYQSIPQALYGERDALSFKRYAQNLLGVPEENVILLTGSRATRTGIAKYVEEWLPRNVGENSRVYFYYSGHGAPDPVNGTAYLLPWDGDPSFLETSAYPVAHLYRKLARLKAKEIVVALDSCFSGAGGRSVLAKGARPLVNKIDMGPVEPKLSVLTASSGAEIAGSLDDQGHGLFTYYLLKGLKGEASDAQGRVSIGALRDYLDANVRRAARRQNREQTPQLKAADEQLLLY